MRAEIWPIEPVFDELGEDGFRRVIAPLQEEVKRRGLWAPRDGPSLPLSIGASLQAAMEKAFAGRAGSAVALDP